MPAPAEIAMKFALSVSIVLFHTPRRQVFALLDSLAIACARARAELPLGEVGITLIDNSDGKTAPAEFSSGDVKEMSRFFELENCEQKLRHGHGNVGYGTAHNLAIGESAAEYHLLLNPDVELAPDALAAGLAYLSEDSGAVLVSPVVIPEPNPGGERQYLCKRYPSLLVLLLRGLAPAILRKPFAGKLAAYEMRDLPADEPTAGIPIASGCCMLCRTVALREVGGFDEGYFLYFEDFDLSLRLGRLGRLVHLPAMRIRHEGGNAAAKGLRHIAMFCRSGLRFFNRHGWKWL